MTTLKQDIQKILVVHEMDTIRASSIDNRVEREKWLTEQREKTLAAIDELINNLEEK